MMKSIQQMAGLYRTLIPLLVVFILILAAIANPPTYRIFTTEMPPNAYHVDFVGFTLWPISVLLLNYGITYFLGYAMIRHVVVNVPVALITRIFAGFLFGYLGVLALARIFSLYLTGMIFYVAVALSAVGIGRYLLTAQTDPSDTSRDAHTPLYKLSITFLIAVGGMCFVLMALGMQITAGEFSWVGHGPWQYAESLQTWVTQGMLHFPIIFQHYDELLYHYWATLFFIPDFNPIIPWWLTLALVKLSTLSFIYIAFRKFNVHYSLALIMSLFLMLGTSAPWMTKYYLLFDSSNPLFFTVHSGRIVGVGAALLLLLTSLWTQHRTSPQQETMALLLLGVGLTTTSLSNSLWALCIALLLFCTRETQTLKPVDEHKVQYFQYNRMRGALLMIPLTILLLLCMQPLTALPVAPSIVYGYLLLCTVFAFFCIKSLSQYLAMIHVHAPIQAPRHENQRLLYFMATTLIALLCLGNVPSLLLYKLFPFISHLFPHELSPQSLSADMLQVPDRQWSLFIGDHREISRAHYNVLGEFAAYYGVFLFAGLALMSVVLRRMMQHRVFNAQDRTLLFVFLCLMACMPLLFFFMNYVDLSKTAWLKSRFLEIPLYLILFICLYFAGRFLRQQAQWALSLILLLYCIVPFIATHRIEQIWINAHSLSLSAILPTVQASSQLQNYGPQGLFQDSIQEQGPGWHAAPNPPYPQTLTIDLHDVRPFHTIGFLPQDQCGQRAPKKIHIQLSNDNITWHSAGAYTNTCVANHLPSTWTHITLHEQHQARFIKIDILANCGDPELLTLRGLSVE